jgi:hypothetical protein
MNFVKFWTTVERYPWVLSVLGGFLPRETLLAEEGPEFLGRMFRPSAIDERIAYIAFRPWDSLDQDGRKMGKRVSFGSRATEGEQVRDVETSVEFRAYSHRESLVPFWQEARLEHQETVHDMLSRLGDQGSIIDAVVKSSWVCLEIASPRALSKEDNLIRAIMNKKRLFHTKMAFDIYLPSLKV